MSTGMPEAPQVVIVGAGPTGVTAASLLAQYGVRTLVLDRWADVYPQPRAVHLDDEVHRILGRLGLDAEFAKISRPARGLRLLDRDHGVLAEFQRDRLVGVHGHPQANMFDQPELEAVLRRHLATLPEVTFAGDVEVTGVEQVAWDRVRVRWTDRHTDEEHTVEAPFVLGCDGANSTVRHAIGARMTDLGFEQRWLVIDIDTERDLDAWDGVHQVCDTERAATYMRVGATRYRWEFQLLDGESAEDHATLDRLGPLLAPWTGTGPDALGGLTVRRVAEYTFRAQVADRWRDGRVFLLGDAAHLTPPFIGQGMGAGLRDALNLTWKVAGVLAGTLPESWLATYESEREPHARTLIRTAVWMGRSMTQGGRLGDLARRLIVPRVQHLPGLRQQIIDGTSPRLRIAGSVGRGGGRLAGRLCPNAPVAVASDCRWDDSPIAGRFAVVTTAPASQHTRTLVAARGGIVLDAAPGTALYGWLEAGGARAALVRPDGAVQAAGASTAALAALVPDFPTPRTDRGSR
ncbi:bifunctional 3-(3-hydroxy-phenyl)propionate/3-hydroxycinnamic acid hydroxylase [Nocardioides sp. YIM 152588]|uniref:bifunctional 3-(3-hydroxy-phenyl)propionate/3-hydroxycinnamic acid hydroxylase MhpA n=1 Tax=Nocardioides sp. YIM 152588 TaxID=3158259 RepID=UPI0032E3C6DE